MPHVFSTAVSLAANLHFIASLPNSYLLELDQNPNPLRSELLDRPIVPDRHGVVTVPDGPGLGRAGPRDAAPLRLGALAHQHGLS